jgi:hypothetical protein
MELFASYRLRPDCGICSQRSYCGVRSCKCNCAHLIERMPLERDPVQNYKPCYCPLELASSAAAFQQVLDQGDESYNVKVIRLNTYLDFVFIASYWSLFLSSLLESLSQSRYLFQSRQPLSLTWEKITEFWRASPS